MVSGMLLARGHHIIGYSRDEQKQALVKPCENLTLYLGDIRDQDRLVEATRGVDIIMHFAALKMVDKIEENPEEAIFTNIIGTQNVMHAQRTNRIKKVLLASTDKAVLPINAYGATKLLSERLILRNPNNVVCRYGNVLGSRGSVLPMFVSSLKSDAMAYVTDRKMTRFWITADRAASFVIECALGSHQGLQIPTLASSTLPDLVDAIATNLRLTEYGITEIGVRAGEKFHECLQSEYESLNGVFSNDSLMKPEQLELMVAEAMRDL